MVAMGGFDPEGSERSDENPGTSNIFNLGSVPNETR